MEKNTYKETLSKYTNEELLKILNEKRSEYKFEAIAAVEEILQERGVAYTSKTYVATRTHTIENTQNETSYLEDIYVSSKYRRFFEYLIDRIAIYILVVAYLCTKDEYEVLYMSEGEYILISVCILLAYYFILELLFSQTLGKLILGLQVVGEDGKKPSVMAILKRTIFRLIPFDALSFLFGGWDDGELTGSWHDRLSRTYVAERAKIKEYGNK